MGAAGELANKEGCLLVAHLHVGVHAGLVRTSVAAADFDGFESGRFPVVKHQILVVVLAVDVQLDFDEVTAGEHVAGFQWDAFVFLHLVVDDLAAGAGGGLLCLDTLQLVVGAADFHFQSSLLDEVLFGKHGEVGVGVEGAVSFSEYLHLVLACAEGITCDDHFVVVAEQVFLGDFHGLNFFAVHADGDFGFRIVFAGGAHVVGDGLNAVGGVAGGVPVGGVLAVVDEILHQSASLLGLGFGGCQ